MRTLSLSLVLLLAAALAAEPALAQKHGPKDKVTEDEAAAGKGNTEDAAGIMKLALPFKEVQTLRYLNGDGEYQGYAIRRHRTIRFYDASGTFIGKAERMTQRLTLYYAPDGTLIGRRLHQKMTVANTATYPKPGRGFLDAAPEAEGAAQ
jgi:hypothetical protein